MLHDGLGVLALREARACQEAAKAAVLDDHLPAAQLADLLGLLLGHLEAGVLEGFLRLLHVLVEAGIEIGKHLLPGKLALLYLVELLLHMRGKGHINDILEALLHKPGDHLAQGRGPQALFLFDDIVAILDGGDDAGVGGRPSHALFLHGAHQRCLGIARRGLGKVLLRLHAGEVEPLSLGKIRKRRLHLLLLVVLALLIECSKAGELEALMVGAELIHAAGRFNGHIVIESAGHLRSGEAIPDKLIEPELILVEVCPHPLGIQRYIAGTNGLMGILGSGLGLIAMGLSIVILLAPPAEDIVLGRSQGFLRDALRVGTHIGDETHSANAGNLHAFIELLRQGHGALGRHTQLPGCLLLEGGGDKGRGRAALFLGALDALYRKGLSLHRSNDAVYLILIVEIPLLGIAVKACGESAGLFLPRQVDVDGPVLLGLEGADFLLAIHHQPGGHRLHPSGRKAAAHLLPQQWGELVAHNTVEDPARLLGVHQILIDGAGVLNGAGHHAAGDLIEGHPVHLVVGNAQKRLEMPGDGLALAIRVGCQIYLIALFRGCFQISNDVFLALDGLIDRREVVLQVHAHGALGQIP